MAPDGTALRRTWEFNRYRALATILPLAPLGPAYHEARWHGRRYYQRHRDAFAGRATDMQTRLSASSADVEAWLSRYFELASSEKFERHLLPRMSARDIARLIEIRGIGHLEDALGRGNGAILYSGHVMGHWTFYVALSLLGVQLNMVGFPDTHEQRVANRQNEFMERRLGTRFLRMTRAEFGVGVKAVNALRGNGVVTIEIDQAQSMRRLGVEFLGGRGYFPIGPAEIARISGAPMLPFWIHRPQRWSPQIAEIGPPFFVDDVPTAVGHLAGSLERSISKDPPSWLPWLFSRRYVWEAPRGGA